MHSKIVILGERFADLRRRHEVEGSDKNAIKRAIEFENKTYELDKYDKLIGSFIIDT